MAFFVCPNCSYTQEAPDAYVGRTSKCLKCEARGEITKSKPKPPPSVPAVPQAKIAESTIKSNESPPLISISRSDGRIVIGLLAGILTAQLFGLTSTKTSTTQWEYTIVSPMDVLLDIEMKKLGDAGWELVFARRATGDLGPSYEMILRRPK